MLWPLPGQMPAFWLRPEKTLLAWALSPLGALYGMVTAARMSRRGVKAAIPVICIGNLTAGGAGKTPATLAIARILMQLGARPAIISRGYGGTLAGPVAVDPSCHDAGAVGDEPLMMARIMPVIIARHRPGGAALAAMTGATLALMDDGLQNPSLAKNLSIAVIDGAVGTGNGFCLPAGPLRAPVAAQWPYVDAVLIIGDGEPGLKLAEAASRALKPVFTARLAPDASIASALKGQRVLALAGIGRPQKFVDTLASLGADVVATAFFADHHSFSIHQLTEAAARAEAAGARVVTTQKDAARMAGSWDEARLGVLTVLPVTLELDDEAGFTKWLMPMLAAA